MRQAKVMIRAYNSKIFKDSYDFDPIELPSVTLPGDVVLVPTDYDPLNRLIATLADQEAEWQTVELALVWSEGQQPVKASCPNCGRVGEVTSEMLDDEDRGLVCHNCL